MVIVLFFSFFGAVKIEVQNWLNLFFWLFWSCNHFKIAFFAWDLRLSKRYLSIKVPFPFFATTILFLFLLYYPAKASCVVHNAHLIQHEFIVRRDETFTPSSNHFYQDMLAFTATVCFSLSSPSQIVSYI